MLDSLSADFQLFRDPQALMPISNDDSILEKLPLRDIAKRQLLDRMSGPDRHYHSFKHVDLLWERHKRHRDQAETNLQQFDLRIAFAIAFHDSVYVGGARDNEKRSAELWLEISAEVDEADRIWVADTIRATADHILEAARLDLAKPSDYARQWVLDLDLTPLGEAPEVFDSNMALLRSEDRNVDLLAGIRRYASADSIYRCAPIALAFEDLARANFERHLRHAVKEIDPIRHNLPVP